MKKPLEGIKMIDLTHMLSGPYGTMILADLGADTVKVEPPEKGEGTRRLLETDPKHAIHNMGAYFFTLNRNKRSITLDLKDEADVARFYELVKVADIVVNNFSAGVIKKLKIDYEHLSAINPRIITCTVSGFGETGPDNMRPAFDQIAQALGGGMSITGKSKDDAVRAGIPIGDLGGGLFGVIGVLAALNARHTTGRGQHVDISMLDCQISLLNYMATMYSMSGEIQEPIGNSHFVHMPYNTFKTKTELIVIACVGDRFWPPLLDLLGDDALRDEKYDRAVDRQKDKAYIEERMSHILITQEADYWLKKLEEARIPCARVNNMAQAMQDAQILARNMAVELHHPVSGSAIVPGNPVKLSDTNGDTFSSPPLLGAHNEDIMRDWLGKTKKD